MSIDSIEYCHNGEELFPRIVSIIDSAQHHVHMEFFTYDTDQSTQAIIEAMKHAVERGVVVRLLVDNINLE